MLDNQEYSLVMPLGVPYEPKLWVQITLSTIGFIHKTAVNMGMITVTDLTHITTPANRLTHSRLTPSFWRCSQGLADKTPIIDKKAKHP